MIQTKIFLHSVQMNLGIEPVLFVYSGLHSIISNGLLKDVITQRVCEDSNCTSDQNALINSYHHYYRLLETIPSVLPCLILGGWSDYHGRIPLVMTALFGDIMKNAIILIQAVTSWNVSYILTAAALSGITGNWPLIMLACLARGCDSTDPRWRTLKLGCLVGLWWLGQGSGFVIVAYRTRDIDYDTYCLVTMIALVVVLCIEITLVIYTNICVQETVPDFGDYNGSGWKTIIIPVHINSTLNSVFRQRVHNARGCLFMLLGLLVMNDIVMYGEQAISDMYLSFKLHMNKFTYNLIYGGAIMLASITVMLCVLISKRYGVQDTTLGILGSVSTMTTSLLLASVTIYIIWPAYLVPLTYIFNLLVPTIIFSLLSKLVHTSEIGSALASVATINSIIPLSAEIMYKELYASSSSLLVELVYVISILLSITSALLFLFMKKALSPCFGFFDTPERVPLINHSESYQGTVL